jgi:hypothetical protein
MKQLILLVTAFLISAASFADVSSGLSKGSSQLKALGSAWKSYSSIQPKPNSNDITIVYGGADVSRRPTLVPHTATA